jgi:hypothetical protein
LNLRAKNGEEDIYCLPWAVGFTHRDRSSMLERLGGMLLSPGGETEEGEEEPQDDEPELVEETELVRCLLPAGGMPCASLLFTCTCGTVGTVPRPQPHLRSIPPEGRQPDGESRL